MVWRQQEKTARSSRHFGESGGMRLASLDYGGRNPIACALPATPLLGIGVTTRGSGT